MSRVFLAAQAVKVLAILFGLCVILTEPTNEVDCVEVNTFGDQPRTALIYRAADRSIVDWRWLVGPRMLPEKVRPGLWMAAWNDSGKPRVVYCRHLIFTRTAHDVELAERAKLPEAKRRKLAR